jgi:ABC-type amino acid transport substrate-binding protein
MNAFGRAFADVGLSAGPVAPAVLTVNRPLTRSLELYCRGQVLQACFNFRAKIPNPSGTPPPVPLSEVMRFFVLPGAVAATVLAMLATFPASAGDPPRLSDPNNRVARTDLTGLLRLRFLTTLDFPPFNFADPQRRPTGFNVEIARAICAELQIEAKCEIQAMPWEELDAALDGLRGEAIIAGHGITRDLRAARAVSRPYFKFPARFVARSEFKPASTDMYTIARDRKVAVVAGSAHAAMLKAWFREAEAVEVNDEAAAYKALLDGQADLVFGDGVALSFWLASPGEADAAASSPARSCRITSSATAWRSSCARTACASWRRSTPR